MRSPNDFYTYGRDKIRTNRRDKIRTNRRNKAREIKDIFGRLNRISCFIKSTHFLLGYFYFKLVGK
jgi:hypothetical protein